MCVHEWISNKYVMRGDFRTSLHSIQKGCYECKLTKFSVLLSLRNRNNFVPNIKFKFHAFYFKRLISFQYEAVSNDDMFLTVSTG